MYSREGAAEPVQDYRDAETGETFRMRASEWALREYDRRELERQQARASALLAAQRQPLRAERESGACGIRGLLLGTPRRALAAGLIGGALGATAIALVAEAVSTELETRSVGEAAIPTVPAPLEPPARDSDALRRFTQANRREETFPPLLGSVFAPDAIANVYLPLPGASGPRIYATRWSEDVACLVLVTTDERVAVSCGSVEELERTGLQLDAYLPNALTDPLDLSLLTTASMPDAPSIIHVRWRPDGTFDIEDRPVRAHDSTVP
ncbi:hypothetical protein [Microterricola viridarii]|uniref:hypothetical protein n=1 Tax=Microterricola viridarii TaxID=412690 RepID=UPI0012EA58A6|nr:hypothetical protein [Microterricola viridarii]